MEKVQIIGVSETMIQTLYARAKESQKEEYPIYKAIGKLGPIWDLSNKIAVMERLGGKCSG